MALTENDIVLIEKHYEGALTNEEKGILIKKEKLFPDFAEEVDLQKTMIAAIRLEDKRLLKEELKKEAQKIILPAVNRKNIKWYYGIAATLLLLIASVFALLPSKSSLFNANYIPFPESPVTRSENADMGNYTLAMQQYSMGDYEQALATFLMINNNELQDEISLYIGNCYLSMRQVPKAIDYLKIAVNSNNEQIKMQGQWYLGLAYIGIGSKQQAVEQLKLVAKDGNPYTEKATTLLKKLDLVFY